MTKREYLNNIAEAYRDGRIDEKAFDIMVENASLFENAFDPVRDPRIPEWYAEVEYDFDNDPEADFKAYQDDMRLLFYMER